MRIEVVCATPARQDIVEVLLDEGAAAIDALRASGLAGSHPEIGTDAPLGIFGKRVKPDTRLQDGDRVEVYRPLQLDPKEARRAKAAR
ncbi:MAG: RnfH family protein, partial [Burkholderiales bacterium]|nr:RnfH family protein [Burkholderiales bacterium]